MRILRISILVFITIFTFTCARPSGSSQDALSENALSKRAFDRVFPKVGKLSGTVLNVHYFKFKDRNKPNVFKAYCLTNIAIKEPGGGFAKNILNLHRYAMAYALELLTSLRSEEESNEIRDVAGTMMLKTVFESRGYHVDVGKALIGFYLSAEGIEEDLSEIFWAAIKDHVRRQIRDVNKEAHVPDGNLDLALEVSLGAFTEHEPAPEHGFALTTVQDGT